MKSNVWDVGGCKVSTALEEAIRAENVGNQRRSGRSRAVRGVGVKGGGGILPLVDLWLSGGDAASILGAVAVGC